MKNMIIKSKLNGKRENRIFKNIIDVKQIRLKLKKWYYKNINSNYRIYCQKHKQRKLKRGMAL